MKKKSFWKRANRGFLVSLALIACVLIYVLVTQLMLLSVRNELKSLADGVRDLSQSVYLISDEKVQELEDPAALAKEQERLASALEPLFVPDAGYLDAAAQSLLENRPLPNGESERTRTAAEKGKPEIDRCVVEGDVATIRVNYNYDVTGEYYDYENYYKEDEERFTPQPVESAEGTFSVMLTCKKVDGQWKIFRIGSARFYTYDYVFKEAAEG